jgi:hypothetical protein
MKAGRPSYHIPAKWVVVAMPQGPLYFELDGKGNLVDKKMPRQGPPNPAPPPVTPVGAAPEAVVQPTPPRTETPVFTDIDIFGDAFPDFDFDLFS